MKRWQQRAARERKAEEMRHQLAIGMKLREVAAIHGVTRQRVAQLVGGSVYELRPRQGQPEPVGTSRTIRRFWARVTVAESGCWEWTGSRSAAGYGTCHDVENGEQYAHRAVYRIIKGEIPPGLTLDHLCRNRGCVNPDHLEPVSHRENVLRSPIAVAAVNARKTHCAHGHPYSPENTIVAGRGRQCRTCKSTRHLTPEYRAYKAEYDRRRREARQVEKKAA